MLLHHSSLETNRPLTANSTPLGLNRAHFPIVLKPTGHQQSRDHGKIIKCAKVQLILNEITETILFGNIED